MMQKDEKQDETDKNATVTQITTRHNVCRRASLNTSNLEEDRLPSRRPSLKK